MHVKILKMASQLYTFLDLIMVKNGTADII